MSAIVNSSKSSSNDLSLQVSKHFPINMDNIFFPIVSVCSSALIMKHFWLCLSSLYIRLTHHVVLPQPVSAEIIVNSEDRIPLNNLSNKYQPVFIDGMYLGFLTSSHIF